MLRYIYADQLPYYPNLSRSMFRDRTNQFAKRLGWEVNVNAEGEERDEYDGQNPLYIIWELPDGTHGGSMRLLPTVTPTMVNDHFTHLIGGGSIVSPFIWECTRFCLSPRSKTQVAASLMLGGGEIMQNFGVHHLVGVFDDRMIRVYRMIGSAPEVLGCNGESSNKICIGLWEFSEESQAKVAEKAGVSLKCSQEWFRSSFPRGCRDDRHQDAVLLCA